MSAQFPADLGPRAQFCRSSVTLLAPSDRPNLGPQHPLNGGLEGFQAFLKGPFSKHGTLIALVDLLSKWVATLDTGTKPEAPADFLRIG